MAYVTAGDSFREDYRAQSPWGSQGDTKWRGEIVSTPQDKDPGLAGAGGNTVCLQVRESQGRWESQGETAAGGRHQQMVCLAVWDGTVIVDKDAILERGQPHRPSAGVLGQAGERSLSPSARKWDKEGIEAFSSFHFQDSQEAKTDGRRVKDYNCFLSRSRKVPISLGPLRLSYRRVGSENE